MTKNNWHHILTIIVIMAGELMFLIGCKKDEEQSKTKIENGSVTDIDGNTYTTVKIGTQWWMADNLKVTHYRDGSIIENVIDSAAWEPLTTGAYCWFNNNVVNKNVYGAFYNWYAVNTGKLCPTGWHVPSSNEWQTLVSYLGGNMEAGSKMKSGEIGFPPVLGGYRSGWSPYNYPPSYLFGYGGDRGFWWSSTESNPPTEALCADYVLYPVNDWTALEVSGDTGGYPKSDGFSVRCMKDN